MFPDPQLLLPTSGPPPADADGTGFGFRCWHGTPGPMPRAHRHDDIEVNFASGGTLTYLFGGTPLRVQTGRVAAFWAAMPHQLVAITPGASTYWITVPLGLFLHWTMPAGVRSLLLAGRPLLSESGALAPGDHGRFEQWTNDLADPDAEPRLIAMLEIEARMRRLARESLVASPVQLPVVATEPAPGRDPAAHAAAMASFIAAHYDEPITAADVAAARHLHRHYAMTVFRQAIGTTIGSYLAQCRIADAQRRLITTDASITDIGVAAGFSSQSRFYDAFTRLCGMSPGAYRTAHRDR
jgi:AraC family transcriptional regulator, melibiose operon regulatory protein